MKLRTKRGETIASAFAATVRGENNNVGENLIGAGISNSCLKRYSLDNDNLLPNFKVVILAGEYYAKLYGVHSPLFELLYKREIEAMGDYKPFQFNDIAAIDEMSKKFHDFIHSVLTARSQESDGGMELTRGEKIDLRDQLVEFKLFIDGNINALEHDISENSL